MRLKIYISLFLVFLFLGYPSSRAFAAGKNNPDGSCGGEYQYKHKKECYKEINPFSCFIRIYQRYLSPINGNRCPMYPSCSEFALQAINREGVKGLVMTFDRLLRCGRDLREYPLIFRNGRVFYSDPVKHDHE